MATASLDDVTVPVPDVSELRALAEAAAAEEVRPRGPVGVAVRRALAESVLRLLRNQEGARAGEDPEAIHQARVATRRLRAQLASFRRLFSDPGRVVAVRRELAWLGDALGAVREVDVMAARLELHAAALSEHDRRGAVRMIAPLYERRAGAHARLAQVLDAPRYAELLASLRELLEAEAGSGRARKTLRRVMRARWRKLKRAAPRVTSTSNDAELHRVRILVKRARYTAEAAAPAFGRGAARRFGRTAAALQDVLGAHQDVVIAERWLRERARHASPDIAFVAGMLAEQEHRSRAEARERWPAVWRALRRGKLRFWR